MTSPGWLLHKPGSAAPGAVASSAAAVTPDTTAAAQSAAQQFFTFYSAGQWDDAWQYLTAADKREAPESVYAAVHQQCPSAAAGMAYATKGVTLAGQTAVVTYTVSGATGALLGNATMPMTWTPSGWGVEPSGMSVYTHGNVSADLAAAKAAGRLRRLGRLQSRAVLRSLRARQVMRARGYGTTYGLERSAATASTRSGGNGGFATRFPVRMASTRLALLTSCMKAFTGVGLAG